MKILYIALAPLLLVAIYTRVKALISAVKEKNRDKVKVELLFLSLIILVSFIIVFIAER